MWISIYFHRSKWCVDTIFLQPSSLCWCAYTQCRPYSAPTVSNNRGGDDSHATYFAPTSCQCQWGFGGPVVVTCLYECFFWQRAFKGSAMNWLDFVSLFLLLLFMPLSNSATNEEDPVASSRTVFLSRYVLVHSCTIFLFVGWWNIDNPYRNPNMNNKDHRVG